MTAPKGLNGESPKLIKTSTLWKGIAILAALVIAPFMALAIAFLTLDPNILKPQLEKALAEQGFSATLGGDLSWSFYPIVGVKVEDVRINEAHKTPLAPQQTHLEPPPIKTPLLDIGRAELGVAMLPLFKRKIEVVSVVLNDVTLNYHIGKDGSSNWDKLTAKTEAAPQNQAASAPSSAPNGSPPVAGTEPRTDVATKTDSATEIRISSIDTHNLNISYRDATSSAIADIHLAYLRSRDVNLKGNEFPLDLDMTIKQADTPDLRVIIDTRLKFESAQPRLEIVSAEFDISTNKLSTAQAKLTLSALVNWTDGVDVTGKLATSMVNPRPWLEVFDLEAPATRTKLNFSKLGLATAFSINQDKIQLNKTQVSMDDSQITGNLEYSLTSDSTTGSSSTIGKIQGIWRLDSINLDDYIAETAPQAEDENSDTATELPLELMRSLDLSLSFSAGNITLYEQSFKNLELDIKAQKGYMSLQLNKLELLGGSATANVKLNANAKPSSLTYKVQTKNIDAGAALTQLADFDKLQGRVDVLAEGSSKGDTDKALINNFIADAKVNANNMRISSLNLTQEYCELITSLSTLGTSSTEHKWEEYTELEAVTAKLIYADNGVQVTELLASIQKLSTKASGKIVLSSGDFNFPIDISLATFASDKRCPALNDSWRNKTLPLLCKGNIDTINYDTCLPDRARIGDKLKLRAKLEADKISNKAEAEYREERDKLKDKAESEVADERQKLQEKAAEELKDSKAKLKEKTDKLEDKFKGLMGKD